MIDVEHRTAGAIRALKSRYFRAVDAKDWDGFAAVFAPGATLEVLRPDGSRVYRLEGAPTIVELVEAKIRGARTHHRGQLVDLALAGANAAEGRWAMHDWLTWPDRRFRGSGHYHEYYVRRRGRWHIARCVLRRSLMTWSSP